MAEFTRDAHESGWVHWLCRDDGGPPDLSDDMIERGGRALCAHEIATEYPHVPIAYEDWRDEFDAKARAVLVAALASTQGREGE